MMAGNPNWWSISTMHPHHHHNHNHSSSSPPLPPPPPPPPHHPHEYFYGSNSSNLSSSSPTSLPDDYHHHHHHHSNNQDFPRSWSQLLLGGLGGSEQERFVISSNSSSTSPSPSPFQYKNKLENWEDQILNHHHHHPSPVVDVKQEVVVAAAAGAHETSNLLYGGGGGHGVIEHEFHGSNYTNTHSWPQIIMPPASASSSSVITSLTSTSLLNFSTTQPTGSTTSNNNHNNIHLPPPPDNTSECNSSSAGGGHVLKRPKIQHSSSTQPILKVRKEKLGDRITALHQLVSPFGKTDTASVLSEAIGYIRFLQAQIEALSSPYLGNVSAASSMGHQHQSESLQVNRPKDLRSRGLCLAPVSCTQQIGSENGADYWAPALGGGF